MHKKLLPFLFLSGISFASSAQTAPTLTAATINPQLNDAYISHVCDPTLVTSPGPGGANVAWNFGSLITTQIDTGRCVPVASTTAGAAIVLVSPTTNAAVQTPTSGTTTYYYTSTLKYSATGYYQSSTQNTYYTDPMDLLQYPVTYHSTYFDTYSGSVMMPGLPAPIKGSGIVYDTCDGWGTLKLPGSITYPSTLRIHSYQKYIDTANLFGTGPADSFLIETYTWYTPNYHSALLTINFTTGLGLATGINYELVSYDSMKLSDAKVPVISNIEGSLKLFPNPVKNELKINFDAGAIGAQVRITLVDMLGREVAVIADKYADRAQSVTFNTTGIPKGLYLVNLQAANETVTRKIEVE